MANAYDRMRDAVILRIDEQIKTIRDQGEEITPMSSEAANADKVALATMYRNAFIKAMRVSAGFVVEEHKKLSEPRIVTPDAPAQRQAPYSTHRRVNNGVTNG